LPSAYGVPIIYPLIKSQNKLCLTSKEFYSKTDKRTAEKDMNVQLYGWSSQLYTQLKQLWNFFQVLISQLLKLCVYFDDQPYIHIFLRSSNMIFYIFIYIDFL